MAENFRPIQWDFEKLEMMFKLGEKKVILQGLTNVKDEVSDPPLTKITKLQPGVILYLLNSEEKLKLRESISTSIQNMLKDFPEILKDSITNFKEGLYDNRNPKNFIKGKVKFLKNNYVSCFIMHSLGKY